MWCQLCVRRGHRVKLSHPTAPLKRGGYFTCSTLVVWDVDLLSAEDVKVYRANDPDHPTIYRRGDITEAEPAVPGWRMPLDDLFA